MNQTKNIIDFFEHIIKDDRLLPSHISMYISLFQLWSFNSFRNPFRISREDVMKVSKIKSLATYHKCIRELHQAGFIIYSPSYNSYRGSLIEMTDFDSEAIFDSALVQEQKAFSGTEICFTAPMFCAVELYFNERDFPSAEASAFYSFYQSRNWLLYNSQLMTSWEAAARNWISELKKSDRNIPAENNSQ